MTGQRLREILYFFRANPVTLLAVTLPFATAGTLVVQAFGEPLLIREDEPGSVQWQSALLLVLLYPLALGVKTLAIHAIAQTQLLQPIPLLADALRLWPTMAAISLLGGLFVGSVTMLSLGIGIELLNGLGLLRGIGGGLVLLFALPGVWLYARIGCASIIAAAENRGALDALGAAWRRSREEHLPMFTTLLAVGSGLVLVLATVFALLGLSGDATAPAAADLLVRGLSEWLFCLVTITFYRFWSLLPRES